MMQERTIYIVDDDPAARKSVAMLVETMGIATETFASGEEFLSAFDESRGGCLVTDLRMLGMTGIELQENLASRGSKLPVIIITAYADVPLAVRAMKSGAVTFLEKPCRNEELWDAIREALARDAENRRLHAKRVDVESRLARLSQKERLLMDKLLAGKTHKVISQELDISIRTVETRRNKILSKMQTDTLVELGRLIAEMKTSGLADSSSKPS